MFTPLPMKAYTRTRRLAGILPDLSASLRMSPDVLKSLQTCERIGDEVKLHTGPVRMKDERVYNIPSTPDRRGSCPRSLLAL